MDEETLWDDVKDQLTRRVNGGMVANSYSGQAYVTGHGGPYQGNVTVSKGSSTPSSSGSATTRRRRG